MSYYKSTRDGNVFILTMTNGDDDNRFTSDVLVELNRHLDEMENYEGNASMILTSSHEKTWTTGINLDFMLNLEQDKLFAFTQELKRTILRVALLNMPTCMYHRELLCCRSHSGQRYGLQTDASGPGTFLLSGSRY